MQDRPPQASLVADPPQRLGTALFVGSCNVFQCSHRPCLPLVSGKGPQAACAALQTCRVSRLIHHRTRHQSPPCSAPRSRECFAAAAVELLGLPRGSLQSPIAIASEACEQGVMDLHKGKTRSAGGSLLRRMTGPNAPPSAQVPTVSRRWAALAPEALRGATATKLHHLPVWDRHLCQACHASKANICNLPAVTSQDRNHWNRCLHASNRAFPPRSNAARNMRQSGDMLPSSSCRAAAKHARQGSFNSPGQQGDLTTDWSIMFIS